MAVIDATGIACTAIGIPEASGAEATVCRRDGAATAPGQGTGSAGAASRSDRHGFAHKSMHAVFQASRECFAARLRLGGGSSAIARAQWQDTAGCALFISIFGAEPMIPETPLHFSAPIDLLWRV